MERFTSDQPLPEQFRGAVLALGNFDGFHLGHQAVASRAIARAFHERRRVMIATFDPHPVRFFRPDTPPFQLTSMEQRARLFAHAGADAMLAFNFDADLASTDAEDFVAEVLGRKLGIAVVVTGQDFTFGRGRSGNTDLLRDVGAANDIGAESVAPVRLDEDIVSSSRIRKLLADGDPGAATHLLTRPFAIEAVVEHGDGRGRKLGYPTANVRLGNYQRPQRGIYAVTVRLDDGSEHQGAASFGIRPMFDGGDEILEVYIFDFDGDLYGRTIDIALVAYLRPEAKFDSIDALIAQMGEDERAARGLLGAAL